MSISKIFSISVQLLGSSVTVLYVFFETQGFCYEFEVQTRVVNLRLDELGQAGQA